MDLRKRSKEERIKDGILNPKIIYTPNGFKMGDKVLYDATKNKYHTSLKNGWTKSIQMKVGEICGLKHYGFGWLGKDIWIACVEFYDDIGQVSCWKYGKWRHSRWLYENCLTKIIEG